MLAPEPCDDLGNSVVPALDGAKVREPIGSCPVAQGTLHPEAPVAEWRCRRWMPRIGGFHRPMVCSLSVLGKSRRWLSGVAVASPGYIRQEVLKPVNAG